MKTLILILAIGLSLISCSKESNNPSEYPRIYNLSFELLRTDGRIYENDEIEISNYVQMIKGQLFPIGSDIPWNNLGKLPYIEENNGAPILD